MDDFEGEMIWSAEDDEPETLEELSREDPDTVAEIEMLVERHDRLESRCPNHAEEGGERDPHTRQRSIRRSRRPPDRPVIEAKRPAQPALQTSPHYS